MTSADPLAAFQAELGSVAADIVCDTTPARRALFGQDIFYKGDPVLAVAAPRSGAEVAAIVRAAGVCGLHVVPRGGGMSYTRGYLTADPQRCIALDMGAMDAVSQICAADMYAVVEPGCTWRTLHQQLEPLGLRAAFWGPLSGGVATIGGGVSQNAIFWGSGRGGSAADAVLGLEVVTGTGQVLRTGSLGIAQATPFFRHFGPDLTGLFTSDAGALGIKTKIVLRLVAAATAHESLCFVTDDIGALCALLSEVARRGLAAQQMGLDAELRDARMQSEGLWSSLKHLVRVIGHNRALTKGLIDALRMVWAGRGVADGRRFSAHIFLEGRSAAAVKADAAAIRDIAERLGADAVESSIAKVMQATPFGPLNGMLGPHGERWAPVHGIVPHSRATAAFDAIQTVLHRRREEMQAHAIEVGFLFTTVGSGALVIEPMFLWPDALEAIHAASIDAKRLARFPKHAAAEGARDAVQAIRREIIAAVDALGAVHIQIGRLYPFAERLDGPALTMLASVRKHLDPHNVINPGALFDADRS